MSSFFFIVARTSIVVRTPNPLAGQGLRYVLDCLNKGISSVLLK